MSGNTSLAALPPDEREYFSCGFAAQ